MDVLHSCDKTSNASRHARIYVTVPAHRSAQESRSCSGSTTPAAIAFILGSCADEMGLRIHQRHVISLCSVRVSFIEEKHDSRPQIDVIIVSYISYAITLTSDATI